MTDRNGLVRIVFPLEQDEDGYPPTDAESVWAAQQADGFAIDNIPFFVNGIALGDVVGATEGDGELIFESLLRASTNSTLRIAADEGRMGDVRAKLSSLGCRVEGSHLPVLCAANVPSTVDLAAVVEALLADGVEVEVAADRQGRS